jgi:beta-glucosidase
MSEQQVTFPPDFLWGVATSAYQIEGAAAADGKGPSVWDNFCRIPGKVANGETGDVACDHYHRFREDVGLMAELQVPAYRFSISWPRVLPNGIGTVNPAGLGFYDALVDELLAKGIEPWVTLFHWDFPQQLAEQGGWLNPHSPEWFAEYTRVIVERLGDRVRNWFTINEPQSFLRFGHVEGGNAPGLELPLAERLLASHHVMLAHGRSVQTIREHSPQPVKVGWAPVGVAAVPATNSAADIEAAQLAMADTPTSLWSNTWFSDPVYFGKYPEAGERAFGEAMPKYTADEMKVISSPVDFLGINIYTGTIVKSDGAGGFTEVPFGPGHPRNSFDWPMLEESLYWGPRFHAERYDSPIYITENGMPNLDWIDLNGKVVDPQRIDYLKRYMRQLNQAMRDGSDVKGYFVWSFLDNMEWAAGYNKRFGIIHVDFATQKRTIKESARWYREVIRANGFSI